MLFRILLEKISTFWRYYSKAKTIYKVHSPFVYSFIDEVINNDHMYYAFEILESHRKNILQSKETVMFQEMGAGSKVLKNQNADGTWKDVGGGKAIPHGARFQGGGEAQFYRNCLATLMLEVYYRFLPSAAH